MSKNFYLVDDIERINSSFTPPDETPIMRYMDFSKYLDMLEKSL